MSVLAFERKQDTGEWSTAELGAILAALGSAITPASGRTWETGTTEHGDAQFYLLGARPEQTCELCLSRLDGRYILEDGCGRSLFEHRNLDLVALHAKAAVPRTHWLVVRTIALWCAVRSTLHEKVEPLLVEGEELAVQIFPQLAAFA